MTQGNRKESGDFASNYKEGTVYISQFPQGKFISRTFNESQEETGFNIQLSQKISVSAVYIREKGDIVSIKLTKYKGNQLSQQMDLRGFDLSKIHEFLQLLKTSELSALSGHFRPTPVFDYITSDLVTALKVLCQKEDATDMISALLDHDCVTSRDIVNTGYRKKGLHTFENLILYDDFWQTYASEQNLSLHSEEKVFQHFLEKNEWIFGYGLDYRFKSILQREAHVSAGDLDGSNTSIADYLLADKSFITFVELKKPSTRLFGGVKNRAGAWSLSTELIHAVSQILEQKSAGQVRLETTRQYVNGEEVQQRAWDSKVVLIIGKWSELDGCPPQEKEIKRRTLELFRRDSRNIEILTYDELLERAAFIVARSTARAETHPTEVGEN
jgi:hypothetical protein